MDQDLTTDLECTTFAPATIAMVNANVKHNLNSNPNPNLNPYPILIQKYHYPHSNSLLLEISSQEQLSPEQMSDHPDMRYILLSLGDILMHYA